MKETQHRMYWPIVLTLAWVLPFAVLMTLQPEALTGLTQLLPPKRWLFFLSVAATGIVAGLFVGTELGQLKVQEGLGAQEFMFFKQRFELAVGRIMPPVLILTTLSPFPLLYLLRRGSKATLVLVALACALWVGATAVTLILNVPVNSLAARWDVENPPANWEDLRARWHLGQTIRTALTLPAFTCLLLAALADELCQ
jgi:uncharacterized membrane protein